MMPAPKHPDFPWLEGLNPPQREAVLTTDGAVLMLAGAGTGKTRTLITRLAHMVLTRQYWPSQILAVTFTNKAAREMKDRIAHLLGESVDGWAIGTFHAIAARILRRHAEMVGLTASFTILDDDDQIRIIKQMMEIEDIDSKKWPPRALHAAISRWKDKALSPAALGASEGGDLAGGKSIKIYAMYQERLRNLNACDFGDLLLHLITIFRQNPDILQYWQDKYRTILVDEYQDTNTAQYQFLRLLAEKHGNICCVGDDDQSIYGWRGAEIGNILRFESDYPTARIIRLEQNYRSTGHILAAASGLIAHNAGRLGKTLWTEAESGHKIRVRAVWDGAEEARFVADECESWRNRGRNLADIAVLIRAGHQTRAFEERFLRIGLPYRVIGGPRFYERAEIRDMIAYLRTISQPQDDMAFERMLGVPKRGIGDATLQALHRQARYQRIPLQEAAWQLLETDDLRTAARNALRLSLNELARWRSLWQNGTAPSDLCKTILDDSGMMRMWREDKSPEAAGRVDNLKELAVALAEFETLEGFLEHVALSTEGMEGERGDMVTLMTLHAAKGLEFELVFLPGWEEGLFPNQRALDETGLAGLEEERRLAYVGLTRARQQAVLSHASNRMIFGQWLNALPSRFIEEIPAETLALETEHDSSQSWSPHGQSPIPPRHLYSSENYSGGLMGVADRPQTSWSKAPIIDVQSSIVRERQSPTGGFKAGQKVHHDKLGHGIILSVEGDKLNISFDRVGQKKVMAGFVTAA